MKKESFTLNNKGYINIIFIIILIFLSLFLFSNINVNATPSIVALNFTNLFANQTITATTSVNITFNVTFDGENQHNVTLFLYNGSTGITFVKDVNFTEITNGSRYSYLYNESNYTKGDTIVVELKFWNGTDANYIYYSNISSYINATQNYKIGKSDCNETYQFCNITDCLLTINNTNVSICNLSESGVYNEPYNVFYNISSPTEQRGILEINVGDVEIDFSGTIIQDDYNTSLMYGIHFQKSFNTSLDYENITIKNVVIRNYTMGLINGNTAAEPTSCATFQAGINNILFKNVTVSGGSVFSVNATNSTYTYIDADMLYPNDYSNVSLANISSHVRFHSWDSGQSGINNVYVINTTKSIMFADYRFQVQNITILNSILRGLNPWANNCIYIALAGGILEDTLIKNIDCGSAAGGVIYVNRSYIENFTTGSIDLSLFNSNITKLTLYGNAEVRQWYGSINDTIIYNGELLMYGKGYNINNLTLNRTGDSCITFNNDNNTISNSTFHCNSTGKMINFGGYGNNIFYNNIFNSTESYGSCFTSVGTETNITLLNNSFSSCRNSKVMGNNWNIINNTFNATGEYNKTSYFVDMIGVSNNSRYFESVRFYTGPLAGSTSQAITSNNTIIEQGILNGTSSFDLILWVDTLGILQRGANFTLWWNHDNNIGCTALAVVGGNCVYENHAGAFYNGSSGTYPNYVFNDTNVSTPAGTPNANYNGYFFQLEFPIDLQDVTNSNITGNKFYSENTNITTINDHPTSANNTIWYNHFYASGFNQTNNNTGCYSNKGNFYDYRTPYSKMANGECGLVNITSSSQSSGNPVTITWTAQSSYNTITYYLEYIFNNIRTKIGTTTGLSYSWTAPYAAGQNYTINIIPMGSNGTHRNSTIVIETPEQTSSPSSMPSGGGSARDIPPMSRSILENVGGFTTDLEYLKFEGFTEQTITNSIEIKNPSDYNMIIKIIPDKPLNNIIKISEDYILLRPKETKIIDLYVLTKDPLQFNSIIKIVSDEYQRIINVNVDIKSSNIKDFKNETQKINKDLKVDSISSFFIRLGQIANKIISWKLFPWLILLIIVLITGKIIRYYYKKHN